MPVLTIYPYLLGQTWVFDDPRTGLKEEAFVLGMTEMISRLVKTLAGSLSPVTGGRRQGRVARTEILGRRIKQGAGNSSAAYSTRCRLCAGMFMPSPGFSSTGSSSPSNRSLAASFSTKTYSS